ncbi:MarR family transcriptional regulator [Ottowia sp.]|jgi:DNA-binding MarR family transcriptional regulator|uniref:MarR family transcriptional regulator n=1 Tax=Ottowia sp. TaxID=1898956 RepID=UPI0025FFE7A5|nr:MarR family transcriptional regulator [Ottowia sp.]MBK6615304.1 MarR family transcriptional regulator [Ottowia sp.]MBK6746377.1 MarR family transcriptional regulator [Ottowia sp.]
MSTRRLSQSEIERLADFRYQLRRFLRASEALAHAHGCTAQQYLLLLQLRGFPGRQWASLAELAERLQAQPHGVVALVTRCEAAGWVERRASRGDQRLVEVHLTPAGRALVERLASLHDTELRSLREGFSMPAADPAPDPAAPGSRKRDPP